MLYHFLFSFLIILLRFLKVNPGRQLITGSFNPIDSGDWAAEAYQSGADPESSSPAPLLFL
jgi:hypothetical protein